MARWKARRGHVAAAGPAMRLASPTEKRREIVYAAMKAPHLLAGEGLHALFVLADPRVSTPSTWVSPRVKRALAWVAPAGRHLAGDRPDFVEAAAVDTAGPPSKSGRRMRRRRSIENAGHSPRRST